MISLGVHDGDPSWTTERKCALKKYYFVFLLAVFCPTPARLSPVEADKSIGSSATTILGTVWKTEVNEKFGFSIQFPMDENNSSQEPYLINSYGDYVRLLCYDLKKNKVGLYAFRDLSIEKQNNANASANSDDSGEDDDDSWQFDYSLLEHLRADLKLPIGSNIMKDFNAIGGYQPFRSCKIVNLNGIKVIRLLFKQEVGGVYLIYFIPRGQTSWLKIDFIYPEPDAGTAPPGSLSTTPSPAHAHMESDLRAEENNEEAFLKTLKLFEPK